MYLGTSSIRCFTYYNYSYLTNFQLKHIAWIAKHIIPSISVFICYLFFHHPFFKLNNRTPNYSICAAIKPPKFNFFYELLYYFIAFYWVVYSWTSCSPTLPTNYLLSMIFHSYRCRLSAGQQIRHRNKLRRFAFLVSQWRVVQSKASRPQRLAGCRGN